MQDIYVSDQYAELNPTWHEEDSPWKARQIEEIIRKNGLRFETLCEVGCGTGEILLNLSRSFPKAQFAGYEISPHAYQRAKTKEKSNVSFHLANIVEEKDSHHDVVVIADVIEHVEDYISFIKDMRPCGRYKIFHIPLDLSVQSVLRAWPITKLRANVGHLHYFFKDTAIATLKDCGYSVIDYKYTASRLELPNQAFTSALMRLPRKLLFSINPDLAVRLLGGYSLLVLAE
ncbi:class I SAM-dependent methyltransferase [Rhizobium rhizogenes]|uniref:class I SAM-dependent methyltransferase n=1 Tax=Rhizobium rhizogenes TaxID=359 RepID=UPI0004D35825|nr:class I SAM-dependent methyltransferase [Rhizobium rhizogenes]KEA08831.1 methylase [Rhizobium rhizogenes]TQO78859.1 class I SAM-dependent methyltransferase [Rhizobium rhizogenes]